MYQPIPAYQRAEIASKKEIFFQGMYGRRERENIQECWPLLWQSWGQEKKFFPAIYLFIYFFAREDFLVIFSFFLHFFETKDVRTRRRHTLTYIGWGRPRKKNLFWRGFSCFIFFCRGKVFCYLIILFIYGWITVHCLELYAYEVTKHNGLLM